MAILTERIVPGGVGEVNLHDKGVVWSIINEIEHPSNIERKQKEYKAFEVFAGNQKKWVKKELQQMFPQTWNDFTESDISVSKLVTEKRSQAYTQEPVRGLKTEKETALYEKIVKQGKLNSAMRVFDENMNRQWRSGLWVMPPNFDGQPFRFRPLLPHEYDLIIDYDGTEKVVAIKFADQQISQGAGSGVDFNIQQGRGETFKKVYGLWNDTQHVVVQFTKVVSNGRVIEEDIEFRNIPGNAEMTNDLGRLPFSFKQYNFDNELPFVSPLAEQSVTYNVMQSIMMTAANVQGFSNLVVSGIGEVIDKDMTISLFSAFKLLQPDNPDQPQTTADYISPSPDLSGMQQIIQSFRTQVLEDHGIKAGQAEGGVERFTSGFDRLLANADVQNIVEENQTLYQEVEKDVYEIVKAYYDSKGGRTFSDDSVYVKYKKPKPITSESETLDIIQKKLDLGLIEEWEKFKILDPNMTDEQARAKMEAIEEQRLARMPSFEQREENTQADNQ